MSYLVKLCGTVLRYFNVLIDPIIYIVDSTSSSRYRAQLGPPRTMVCVPQRPAEKPRTDFTDTGATLLGWPSRGGVIVPLLAITRH